MRWQIKSAILWLLLSLLPAFATNDQTLQQLEAKAETGRPEDRVQVCLEIAERQLKAADDAFKDGKPEEAKAAVNDVVHYADKARDAAIQSGKHVKNTEIALRKSAAKLRDIKRTVNFDDQAPLQTASDDLEKIRTDLLSHMFRKGGK
jgi:hypothetical protein